MRLGLLHIKQCVSKHEENSNGANPLRNPSPKKKATYNCPVAVPLTGRGMCKWLSSVDRNDNERIINTVFQVVSRGIKKNPLTSKVKG